MRAWMCLEHSRNARSVLVLVTSMAWAWMDGDKDDGLLITLTRVARPSFG